MEYKLPGGIFIAGSAKDWASERILKVRLRRGIRRDHLDPREYIRTAKNSIFKRAPFDRIGLPSKEIMTRIYKFLSYEAGMRTLVATPVIGFPIVTSGM
jgi:hypothetical protein